MMIPSEDESQLDRFLSHILLMSFILFVVLLMFSYPGVIPLLLQVLSITIAVFAFIIIQRRDMASKINIVFGNEKKFLIILLSISILCRIFFINTLKTTVDVISDIRTANLILDRGVSFYFTNFVTIRRIGTQYPPLYPLLLAAIFPFGVTLQYVKLFSVIVGSLTIVPTYFIGKELYNERIATISALLMFALPYPFLMSLQGYNDIFLTFICTLFMYFFILYVKNGELRDGILAGIIIGMGLLFKYTIIVFYLVILLFAILYTIKNETQILSKVFLVVLVSLLVFIPWIIYMHYTGIIEAQMSTLLTRSRPGRSLGLTSKYETSWWFIFLSWSFFLLSPTNSIIVLIFLAHLVYRRKSNWKIVLLFSWALIPFIFYGLFQPLIRYWMIASPTIPLIVATFIEDFSRKQDRSKIFLTTFICSLILCFLVSYLSLVYAPTYHVSHYVRNLWNQLF